MSVERMESKYSRSGFFTHPSNNPLEKHEAHAHRHTNTGNHVKTVI